MKYIAIVVLLIVSCSLIVFVKTSYNPGPIIRAFPLLGGHEPGIYDIAGLIMIILFIRGLCCLGRISRDNTPTVEDYDEVDEPQEDQPEEPSE